MAKKDTKGMEYKLSIREQKFVSYYLESGDAGKAVEKAKFNTTSPKAYAKKLLAKPKIQKEVKNQMDLLKNECVASAQEIMNFYTMAMRGEIKDQFGLEATLADRMKAADALAKRQIDMQAVANKATDNAVTINLVWDRNNSKFDPDIPTIEEEEIIDITDDVETTDEGE